ncbi:MAG: response regulator transcription factor [Propionibacteriaceae bacterium]|nr:response regulator transcription factor [Propionibacteriaceae bacterium]
MTGAIRVVLVDDETLVRTGLRMILEGDPSIEIVGEAADGAAALPVVERTHPDVVLMDIRMPTMDGLAATEQILRHHPGVRIVMLTSYDVDDLVPRALRLGAAGYLLKDTPPQELVEAVRRISAGDTILSQAAIGHLVDAVIRTPLRVENSAAARRLNELTDRERSVALAVARGLSNAQIASELFISITTVKTHVGRILEKLDVRNRVQIAAFLQREIH